MNRRNLLTTLSLVLAVGAVTYAALIPIAMAVQEETNVKGLDGGPGQNGAPGVSHNGQSVINGHNATASIEK